MEAAGGQRLTDDVKTADHGSKEVEVDEPEVVVADTRPHTHAAPPPPRHHSPPSNRRRSF